jgi:hypothetical protein
MTDESMVAFSKLACWYSVKPAAHPKGFGLDRAAQPAILASKPPNSIENQLDLALSMQSSCGYYSSYYTECSG